MYCHNVCIYYRHALAARHFYKNMIRSLRVLLNSKRANPSRFAALPASVLQPQKLPGTEIVSLTMEEMDQLGSITPYSTSIDYLSQNRLSQSQKQLQFALHEARNRYPWSLGLQCCLINRNSILLKLLGRHKQLQEKLQQLYLMTLSSKGPRSLDTVKNLINYLLCLTTHNPNTANAVLSYLQTQDMPPHALFFQALALIRTQRKFKQGLEILAALPEALPCQKIFKLNNMAFMRVHSLRETHTNPFKYLQELKKEAESILQSFINSLIIAENNHQADKKLEKMHEANRQKFLQRILEYSKSEVKQLPIDKLLPKDALLHPHSYIIAMNIASLLFELERLEESFFFVRLSLQAAMSAGELERVGMALILLGRCYYLQGQPHWQEIFLSVLDHSKTYPPLIIKQALSTYSRLLFQQGRCYQAEHYMSQSLSINVHYGLEGLLLPSYDFSY